MSEPSPSPTPSPRTYRRRLLLSELRREAERSNARDSLTEIDELVARADAGDHESPQFDARLRAVAGRWGREVESTAQPARWLSFLRFTGPGLMVVVALAILIERRRRRQREVSEAALAHLDAGSGSDPTKG